MDKITWHIEKRRIAELNPAQYNPRKISPKQVEDLGLSASQRDRVRAIWESRHKKEDA